MTFEPNLQSRPLSFNPLFVIGKSLSHFARYVLAWANTGFECQIVSQLALKLSVDLRTFLAKELYFVVKEYRKGEHNGRLCP